MLPSVDEPATWTASGVNDAGTVIGLAGLTHHAVACVDPCTTPTVMAVPSGYAESAAYAINGGGAVVGEMTGRAGMVAALWSSPTATAIALPALSDSTVSSANGVSDNGEVVGVSGSTAVYWDAQTHAVHVLPTPSGYSNGVARAVASGGTIVGSVRDSSQHDHGVVWSADTHSASVLPTPGQWAWARAVAINSQGLILGMGINTSTYAEGLVWAPGTHATTELPLPSGYGFAAATALNDAGEVVGQAEDLSSPYSFQSGVVWTPVTYVPSLLAKSVVGSTEVVGVTTGGEIVGSQNDPLTWSSTTATPVVLPSVIDAAPMTASAVNAGGEAVGDAGGPFAWDAGTQTAEALPTEGGTAAAAWGLNDAGTIVGLGTIWTGVAHTPAAFPAPPGYSNPSGARWTATAWWREPPRTAGAINTSSSGAPTR